MIGKCCLKLSDRTQFQMTQASKSFTLNQVIDEEKCGDQPCVTFPGIFCKSI